MAAENDEGKALLNALNHPLRRSLLRRYLESDTAYGLGPKELAIAEKVPLSNVSYHIRVLAEHGALELVSEVHSHGSIAHFYEATALVKETPWVIAVLKLER